VDAGVDAGVLGATIARAMLDWCPQSDLRHARGVGIVNEKGSLALVADSLERTCFYLITRRIVQ